MLRKMAGILINIADILNPIHPVATSYIDNALIKIANHTKEVSVNETSFSYDANVEKVIIASLLNMAEDLDEEGYESIADDIDQAMKAMGKS